MLEHNITPNKFEHIDKFNELFSLLQDIRTFSSISKKCLIKLAASYEIDVDSMAVLIFIYGGEVNR